MFGHIKWASLVLTSVLTVLSQAQKTEPGLSISSAVSILAGNGIYGNIYFNITSAAANNSGKNSTVTSTPSGMLVSGKISIDHQDPTGNDYVLHVHENPVAGDGDCGSTGSHLNPFGADRTNCYKGGDLDKCACQPTNPIERCEVGNLSGKWGKLTLSSNGTVGFNWRDPTLNLSGATGVIGRAVVLHTADMTMVACGSIFAVLPNNTVYNNTINNAGGHSKSPTLNPLVLTGFFAVAMVTWAI